MQHNGVSRTSVLPVSLTLTLLMLSLTVTGCHKEPTLPPPPTRVDDVVEVIHGVEVADPYRWLEDQQSPETRKWIETQNAYADSLLDELSGREELGTRMAELLHTNVISAPVKRGDRYFFLQRNANQDLQVIYMREGPEGKIRF